MRVRDLIPDREALITPDFYRRKNLLVQVIEDDSDNERAGTLNATGPAPVASAPATRSRAEQATRAEDRAVVARSRRVPASLFDDLNWDFATIERLNPDLSTLVIRSIWASRPAGR